MKDVIIVGAGPAGLFAAYNLCETAADVNITVIDKGRPLSKRKCPMRDGKPCAHCEPCNIMCGFGGAGTFSDCKLSLTPCNDVGGDIVSYLGKDAAKTIIDAVEAIFDRFDEDRNKRSVVGKEKNEKYKQIETTLNNEGLELNYCPTKHLGTDGTYKVMESIYSYLVNKGVQFIFNHAVKSVELTNKMTKIVVLDNDEAYMTDYLILAPGRSGNTWLSQLAKNMGIETESNGFDLGYRVELPYSVLAELTDNLYDMKIYYDFGNGFTMRTFCTNPKGFVSEEHYKNIALANGHSYADKKSDNTNFAVLMHFPDMKTEDAVTILENYNKATNNSVVMTNIYKMFDLKYDTNNITVPTMKVKNPDLWPEGILPRDLNRCFILFMSRLDYAYPGVFMPTTNIYGVEAKFYSDRIKVKNNFETSIPGIYCAGDGSGITRGIMKSAATGFVASSDIINKL